MLQESSSQLRRIPTVDISPFAIDQPTVSDTDRLRASRALVAGLHDLGFVQVVGHGLSQSEVNEALRWTKALFDLPYEDKMKAPHPPGPIPHRGYSGIGKEKVYSQEDVGMDSVDANVGQKLRQIRDFKESFEIGSEHDPVQQNIWLPDDTLPNFRSYMTELYEKLCTVSRTVLHAVGIGLDLEGAEQDSLMKLISNRHCQLRLLHYPPISKERLQRDLLARLPPHRDWGTFTLLFQDEQGGLELKDPRTNTFLRADPIEGAFVLNIGDMLQRYTNDYFVSALHQVSIPEPATVSEGGIPARYSIPFFVCPDFTDTVSTLPRFITGSNPAKYDPVRFDEYGSVISKYQYETE
ncbi:Clavaminate synthase-like protein [Xylariaceae sp. FL0594]|nr:Clavaminate synthase-like protein [Xylariaceae sp. FL0594]